MPPVRSICRFHSEFLVAPECALLRYVVDAISRQTAAMEMIRMQNSLAIKRTFLIMLLSRRNLDLEQRNRRSHFPTCDHYYLPLKQWVTSHICSSCSHSLGQSVNIISLKKYPPPRSTLCPWMWNHLWVCWLKSGFPLEICCWFAEFSLESFLYLWLFVRKRSSFHGSMPQENGRGAVHHAGLIPNLEERDVNAYIQPRKRSSLVENTDVMDVDPGNSDNLRTKP